MVEVSGLWMTFETVGGGLGVESAESGFEIAFLMAVMAEMALCMVVSFMEREVVGRCGLFVGARME